MKKVITLFLVLSFCVATFAVDLTLGGRGNLSIGIGSESIKKDYLIESTPNVGGGFSFYAKTGLASFFALQHEIGLSFNNGSKFKTYEEVKYNNDGKNLSIESKGKLNYWRNTTWSIDFMPVTATFQWKFGKEKNFQAGFGAGPFMSILFPVNRFALGPDNEHHYYYSYTQLSSIGIVFDAFFGIKAGPGSVILNTRYIYDDYIRTALSFGVGYEYTF